MSLTPARRRGVEYLDDPRIDLRVRRRSHRDIALANRLFGGSRAVLAELRPLLAHLPAELTLLDVGTGTGDIPARFARIAARLGVTVHVVGLDDQAELVTAARAWPADPVCADALWLPFADRSIDIVCCSQLLHHFMDADASRLLTEMHRVAKRRVIVADLRRSWVAVAALWSFSWVLGFHPVSRHDGVVSILRGYTSRELRALVRGATGVDPVIRRHFGYRLTATWRGSSVQPQ